MQVLIICFDGPAHAVAFLLCLAVPKRLQKNF